MWPRLVRAAILPLSPVRCVSVCSISRRNATAGSSGRSRRRSSARSARRPPCCDSRTWCARPSGSPSSRNDSAAGSTRPYTVAPPSPSSDLARRQVALRRRDDVGIEADRRSGRFAAQADARDADAEFEADQVERLVQRRVLSARIGDQAVLLEAALDVLAAAGENDVHAPAQIAEHRSCHRACRLEITSTCPR